MIILGIFWFAFISYWIISGLNIKKSRGNSLWMRAALLRVVVSVVALYFLSTSPFRHIAINTRQEILHNPMLGIIGLVLTALGIGFAFWARIHIGRNWGRPMTLKESPELVTSGPYAYVRHPIYAGVSFALLGLTLVGGFPWLIVFLVTFAYFFYSAKREEQNMTKDFPKEYPKYMKYTKMLIPFVY